MAVSQIKDDDYIDHLRAMFARTHQQDLEFVLTGESGAIPGCDYFRRSINYHRCMVPWIESCFPLQRASVLEIGCGSAAATLALAQRCGHIDAFDIDESSLAQAHANLEATGLGNVTLNRLDPQWALRENIAHSRSSMRAAYDVVLLPAVLEHMQMNERLPVLEMVWDLLRPGGIMIVYDTPNRLHPYDQHSFRLPFFNWLPDDLALLYASHSPRTDYLAMMQAAADPSHTLYRLGRGLSYHEFDLAIGLSEMDVIQDSYSRLLTHRIINSGFEGMLMEAFRQHAPHVPACFSREFLEFIARKKWQKARLTNRQYVIDEMLDGERPALLLQGEHPFLEYDLGEAPRTTLLVEVLRHPWSAELHIAAEDGKVFHREILTRDFAITGLLHIPLPPQTRRIKLQAFPNPAAQGQQAWILGVGTT